jgi:hypothetical protein
MFAILSVKLDNFDASSSPSGTVTVTIHRDATVAHYKQANS